MRFRNRAGYFLIVSSSLLASCATPTRSQDSKIETKDGFWVEYLDFKPEKGSRKRAVIIVPPTGGVTFIDKSYAKKLAKAGASVRILKNWAKADEKRIDLEVHQEANTKAVRAISILADSFEPEFEVGLLGTSEGGMYSALATVNVPRIKRTLVIGTGIPLREVIATSKYKSMEKLKKKRVEKYGFKSEAEYMAALAPVFPIDGDYGRGIAGKKLGVILFEQDEDVPVKTQKQIVAAWKPEFLRELDNSHMWGILGAWRKLDGEIVQFFVQ